MRKKLFKRKSTNIRDECLSIYEENKHAVFWFLKTRCKLSEQDTYRVMKKMAASLPNWLDDYHLVVEGKHEPWMLYKTHMIALEICENVPEVVSYDRKKI